MAKRAEMDFVIEAKAMGKVISSLSQLPSRIDKAAFAALATSVEQKVSALDTLKKQLASAVNDKDAALKRLKAGIVDVRAAVKGAYGADSNEYEIVGGTRASERKKPGRKKTGAK
jgi:hypothetical protein